MAGQLVENKGDAGFPPLSLWQVSWYRGMQGSYCWKRGYRVLTALSLAGQLVENRGDAGFLVLEKVEGIQGSHCFVSGRSVGRE